MGQEQDALFVGEHHLLQECGLGLQLGVVAAKIDVAVVLLAFKPANGTGGTHVVSVGVFGGVSQNGIAGAFSALVDRLFHDVIVPGRGVVDYLLEMLIVFAVFPVAAPLKSVLLENGVAQIAPVEPVV